MTVEREVDFLGIIVKRSSVGVSHEEEFVSGKKPQLIKVSVLGDTSIQVESSSFYVINEDGPLQQMESWTPRLRIERPVVEGINTILYESPRRLGKRVSFIQRETT